MAFEGIEARAVGVQVQVAPGLPAFNIVGLPDKGVSEPKERVRAALSPGARAAGAPHHHQSRARRPAERGQPPIALGLMAAIGAVPHDTLSGFTVLGELALDGSIPRSRARGRRRSARTPDPKD